MTALVKIRSERDRMSAIERRIADFVLDNAQLLRDYSSQQLANALGISQSSVVKFCQKLGFKGYPDLKLSISEAVVRADNGNGGAPSAVAGTEDAEAIGADLWLRKTEAEQATRLINPPDAVAAVAAAIAAAGKVFIIGLGDDDIHARTLALRLSLLGILTVHNFDPAHMSTSLSATNPGDVLLVFSEHGKQVELCHLAREFRAHHGHVVSITRHTANPLRAHAEIGLVVSAHDERAWIEPLLYQSASQHLLDNVFVLLCESSAQLASNLAASLERARHLLQP